jgi:hypothetical protein
VVHAEGFGFQTNATNTIIIINNNNNYAGSR